MKKRSGSPTTSKSHEDLHYSRVVVKLGTNLLTGGGEGLDLLVMGGLVGLDVVPIINENDVVDVAELGQAIFGDNDNLSAMVANLVDADLLALLTDIDGLYTADPHRDPKATLIPTVERIDKTIEALAG